MASFFLWWLYAQQVLDGCRQVSVPHSAQSVYRRSSNVWGHRHVQGGDRVAGVVLENGETVHRLQQAAQQAAVRVPDKFWLQEAPLTGCQSNVGVLSCAG